MHGRFQNCDAKRVASASYPPPPLAWPWLDLILGYLSSKLGPWGRKVGPLPAPKFNGLWGHQGGGCHRVRGLECYLALRLPPGRMIRSWWFPYVQWVSSTKQSTHSWETKKEKTLLVCIILGQSINLGREEYFGDILKFQYSRISPAFETLRQTNCIANLHTIRSRMPFCECIIFYREGTESHGKPPVHSVVYKI